MSNQTTITDLSKKLLNKEVSAVEISKAFLKRAQSVSQKTNAFITIEPEETLTQAKKADEMIKTGNAKVLCGIPYSLKDAYSTTNMQTTCGSQILTGYAPQYDATLYAKLKENGAVLIGKNNQDAWGHGSTSENTDFSAVKNPWNTSRVAGGSSGGTAVAVATQSGVFGIGEDTGGSIRNPSSFCNTTGLKVTYGRVSRYGAISYASSFDTMGPIAQNAQDCALVLSAIAGYDPKDSSSSKQPADAYENFLNDSVKGKVIGIPTEFFNQGLKAEIKTKIEDALSRLEELGMRIEEISIPTVKYADAIYYILTFAETSSNLARFDAVRFGGDRQLFSSETKRRIMAGTFTLSSGYFDAYYKKASRARTLLIKECEQAFEKVDVIAAPVMPFTAPKIGGMGSEFDKDEAEIAMYLADMYTVLANTVGIPALSLPVGFDSQNLPIGMQLHGKMFDEKSLLNIGHIYQQATDWHKEQPNI